MRKMLFRKVIPLLVIMLLVGSTFAALVVYAAAPSNTKFVVSSKAAAKGENVTVSVMIDINANVLNGMTALHYDSTKLEYVSSSAGAALNGSLSEINDKAANQVTIGFISSKALNAFGSILDVTFKVKDTMVGTTPLTLTVDEWANDDGDSASKAFVVNGIITLGGLTVNATAVNGSIIGNAPSYTYGDTVTLAASPAEGYIFVNWTDKAGNVLSTNQIYSFVITDNIELTANFINRCDINKDGTVSITDLAIVAMNYNAKDTEANWNSYFDFNKDRIIDIFDLVVCSKRI